MLPSRFLAGAARTRTLARQLKEHIETQAVDELERRQAQLTRNAGLANLMMAQIHEPPAQFSGR